MLLSVYAVVDASVDVVAVADVYMLPWKLPMWQLQWMQEMPQMPFILLKWLLPLIVLFSLCFEEG